MTDGWITGKTDMLEYCKRKFGFHSWQSVRYWRKKYKFPVRYLPNGVPYIIQTEIITWAAKYDDIRRKQ
ncbi:MAG TPA: hypothetical protein DDY86_06735 [Syntrophaceae bacterium]|jgi:hypothetical protein|nr:hypothetical protein [Syntrophaceae bacterium]